MDDGPIPRGRQGRRALASVDPAPRARSQGEVVGQLPRTPDGAFFELVRSYLDDLSTGERKVADVLLADYPNAGLETAARLAMRAGVSCPTVLRFVARIGFATFSDFQGRVRRDIQESLGSPSRQYASVDRTVAPGDPSFGASVRDTFIDGLSQAFDDLATTELSRVSGIVADRSRRITVIGGRFSKILATYLAAHLQMLRLGVQAVSEDELAVLNSLTSLRRNDILIAFDFRRYDPDVVKFARAYRSSGGEVVLFTDSGLSPIASVATAVFSTPVESVSPFDSLVPGLAMTETLIAAVAIECGDQGRRRVDEFERHRDGLR